MTKYAIVLLGICAPIIGLAAYTPQPQVSYHDHQLTQTGDGVRTAIFGIKVYHIAHHLDKNKKRTSHIKSADALAKANLAKQLTLHFLRSVGGSKLKGGFYTSLIQNNPNLKSELKPIKPKKRKKPMKLTPLQSEVSAFLDAVGVDVDEGTDMILRYDPKMGLSVSVKEPKKKATPFKHIGGEKLTTLVWRIWFGPKPPKPGKELRAALMKNL